jgi:hypothetical protein
MAISFAFTGGLLHLPVAVDESTDSRRLALLVLGFLAGFSERWAQDTLTSLLPAGQAAPPPTPATPETAPPAATAAAAPIVAPVLPADNVT